MALACAVCGRSDIPVKYCPVCKTNLCQACQRRWLARIKRAGENLLKGHWKDEKGNTRTQGMG